MAFHRDHSRQLHWIGEERSSESNPWQITLSILPAEQTPEACRRIQALWDLLLDDRDNLTARNWPPLRRIRSLRHEKSVEIERAFDNSEY
jgi:hypothetical protein